MASSSDVPGKFDVVINGEGYVLYDAFRNDANAPQKAIQTYTPQFLSRTNVGDEYGDNQQDFWLTYSQKDWSLGEQQHHQGRSEGKRRYWRGTNVDVRVPGQVSLRRATPSVAFSEAVTAACPRGSTVNQNIIAVGPSGGKLWEISPAGSITDRAAHGAGVVNQFGAITDGTDIYLAANGGIRKWDGATYSNFSLSGGSAIEYLNNALYGLAGSSLVRWDTGGTRSTLHTWKGVDGGDRNGNFGRLRAFGGKLVILWSDVASQPEIWIYDGLGVSLVATLPRNFFAYDIEVVNGIVFFSGSFVQISNGTATDLLLRPAVFYFSSGTVGLLWKADAFNSTAITSISTGGHPSLAAFDDGLAFTDDTRGALMFYNPASGGVSTIGTYTVAGSSPLLTSSQRFLLHSRAQTTAYYAPDTTAYASSATVRTSLADFDSSLDKIFRGIKVDFTAGSDGNGGSVDIAYRVGDVDGSYTTLQTGAVSGTEYNLTNITGRSISVEVTLNKGTSTSGPVLKRVYVRAVPKLNQFKRSQWTLNCTGRNDAGLDAQPIQLRDGTTHVKDGKNMATDLRTAASATNPISVTDEFGTYTAVVEDLQLIAIRPQEYVAQVLIREV